MDVAVLATGKPGTREALRLRARIEREVERRTGYRFRVDAKILNTAPISPVRGHQERETRIRTRQGCRDPVRGRRALPVPRLRGDTRLVRPGFAHEGMRMIRDGGIPAHLRELDAAVSDRERYRSPS